MHAVAKDSKGNSTCCINPSRCAFLSPSLNFTSYFCKQPASCFSLVARTFSVLCLVAFLQAPSCVLMRFSLIATVTCCCFVDCAFAFALLVPPALVRYLLLPTSQLHLFGFCAFRPLLHASMLRRVPLWFTAGGRSAGVLLRHMSGHGAIRRLLPGAAWGNLMRPLTTCRSMLQAFALLAGRCWCFSLAASAGLWSIRWLVLGGGPHLVRLLFDAAARWPSATRCGCLLW